MGAGPAPEREGALGLAAALLAGGVAQGVGRFVLTPLLPDMRAAAWVTVMFGAGQVIGPPAIGWLGERSGSLAVAMYGAAAAAVLLVPDLRRRA